MIAYGKIEALAERHPAVFAYRRVYGGEELLVVNNFYGRDTVWESGLDLSGFEKILGNYDGITEEDGKADIMRKNPLQIKQKRIIR